MAKPPPTTSLPPCSDPSILADPRAEGPGGGAQFGRSVLGGCGAVTYRQPVHGRLSCPCGTSPRMKRGQWRERLANPRFSQQFRWVSSPQSPFPAVPLPRATKPAPPPAPLDPLPHDTPVPPLPLPHTHPPLPRRGRHGCSSGTAGDRRLHPRLVLQRDGRRKVGSGRLWGAAGVRRRSRAW